MLDVPGDDSRGFADVERDYVRASYLPDFDWVTYERPSARHLPPVPLAQAPVALVDTCGAHLAAQPPVGASRRAALVPVDAELVLTHSGYDTDRSMPDPKAVHPAHTLLELA